jgi:nucleoside-diphosphate-sugar epimerase
VGKIKKISMNLKDKEILITGGTGFIGSSVLNKLNQLGCQVNLLSLPDGFEWRIENKKKTKFHYIDLLELADVQKLIKDLNPEIIFHLAGIVTPKIDISTIQKTYYMNFKATKNLVIALNECEYELLINTGTGNAYGNNPPPFTEKIREDPLNPYSASKVAATHFCSMFAKIYKKPIITVRPFLTYGPSQIANFFIPKLIYSAIENKELSLTACEQTKDFIYIDDLVDAFIILAKNGEKIINKGIINIGSGKETKLMEVVNLIKNRFSKVNFKIGELPYRIGEPMRFFSSIEKIMKLAEWSPKWSIKDGINETINWWIKNKSIWIKYYKIWD